VALAGAQEIQPHMDAGNAAYLRGDYETARQEFAGAWEIAEKLPPKEPVRYDVLKRLASVRSAAGEFTDADTWLQMAINWRENAFGLNDARVADDLLISAGLCRALKNYDRALLILSRVMAIHRVDGTPSAIADDYSRMGQVYLEQKKPDDAVIVLKTAIEMRQVVLGALDASLVRDLDRLASVYIAQRDSTDVSSHFGSSRSERITRCSPSLWTRSPFFTRTRRNTSGPRKRRIAPTPFARTSSQPAFLLPRPSRPRKGIRQRPWRFTAVRR
jgi:tetratricopeptide (TPR) repeat protein